MAPEDIEAEIERINKIRLDASFLQDLEYCNFAELRLLRKITKYTSLYGDKFGTYISRDLARIYTRDIRLLKKD